MNDFVVTASFRICNVLNVSSNYQGVLPVKHSKNKHNYEHKSKQEPSVFFFSKFIF